MLEGLVSSGLGVSVVLAILLCLQPLTANRLRPGWRRGLWVLLAIRLLIWLPPLPNAPLTLSYAPDTVVFSWPEPTARQDASSSGEASAEPSTPKDAETSERTEYADSPETSETSSRAETGVFTEIEQPSAAAPPMPDSVGQTRALTLETLLTAVWLAGLCVFLGRESILYLRFLRYVRRWARPCASEATCALFRRLVAQAHADVRLSLAVCPGVGSPMITGFARPVLLLPQDEYPAGTAEPLLRHELYHHRKRDVLLKLLWMLANAVHWFNPLVWWMTRRAGRDLELACDEAVTREMDAEHRAAYGHALLEAARSLRGAQVFSTYFYGGKSSMNERISTLCDSAPRRKGYVLLVICVLLLAASCLLVACVPRTAEETGEPDVSSASESSPEAASMPETSPEASVAPTAAPTSSPAPTEALPTGTPENADNASTPEPTASNFRAYAGVWPEKAFEQFRSGTEAELMQVKNILAALTPETTASLVTYTVPYDGTRSRDLTPDEVRYLCLLLSTLQPTVTVASEGEENPSTGGACFVEWTGTSGVHLALSFGDGLGVVMNGVSLGFDLLFDQSLSLFAAAGYLPEGSGLLTEASVAYLLKDKTAEKGSSYGRTVLELYAVDDATAHPVSRADWGSVCALLAVTDEADSSSGFFVVCDAGDTREKYYACFDPTSASLRPELLELYNKAMAGEGVPRWLAHMDPQKVTRAVCDGISADLQSWVQLDVSDPEKTAELAEWLRQNCVVASGERRTTGGQVNARNADWRLDLSFSTGVIYTLWWNGADSLHLSSTDIDGECVYTIGEAEMRAVREWVETCLA